MSFICMRMKNHFHIKVWALNLVLIQRPGWTRKRPIGSQSTVIHFARETVSMLCRIALWACFGTLTPLPLTGALDPIGLRPLVPLWSLHNAVFFIAATLHLDEISKSPENSAQQIFVDNCKIAQKTGAKLFPQNNPIMQFNTKVTQYHVQPQNGRQTHKEIYKRIQFYCIKCFVLLQEVRGVFGQ